MENSEKQSPGIHGVQGAVASPELVFNPSEGQAYEQNLVHPDIPNLGRAEGAQQVFRTVSPPIINLSPNLSPVSEQQSRVSPFYDLRESTRRRSAGQENINQQMHPSPLQCYSGYIAADDSASPKSESPSRKRRKISGSMIDLTNSPSPPPTSWQWEAVSDNTRQVRRRNSIQRGGSGERCNTPRSRRSPGARRRSERNIVRHNDISPERRAFQPPLASHQIHPANLPLQNPQQQQQQSVMVDVEQVHGVPVTMAPFAIPVCTGPHAIPVCTSAHIPVCAAQPTWSFPACSVQLPTCSIQHIPVCSLPQVPLPHPLPHIVPHPHGQANLGPQHHHHHLNTSAQFSQHPPQQRREEGVPIISDHRPPQYSLAPQFHHHHHHHHHPSALTPSPPVLLQEPAVHPSPHDFFGPFQRFYARQRSLIRNTRLRNFPPPPPPPYPGFLLHFLAMLGNPPVPPYVRDLHDDATEVENYEALLNLAERLGEAKPRGLIKAEIEQLPAYRFNADSQRGDSDQTSCVVCMCDFENRQLLRVLPCSHEFHAKCVDKWLKTNRTCPICRADAGEIGNQSE
ncbi:hypothetical protein ACJMK2_006197 [Sinanodonta woodiana]|uniref:RING-type domain-containing protein n=1 Tax=Sinanodonta woodiana TaxID=1069815 RepID=A0ABD3VVH8_SINWO